MWPFIAGMALLLVLVLALRFVASRSEAEGDDYLEDTYGSNRRPYGIYLFPRYLHRFTRKEPEDEGP